MALLAAAVLAGVLPRTGAGVAVTFYGGNAGASGTGTLLDNGNVYSPSGLPTNTSDVLLDSIGTGALSFGTNRTSLTMESLNQTAASAKNTYSVQAISTNNLTLTLGGTQGFTNAYSGNTDDLIYLAGANGTLTLFGPNQNSSTGTLGITLASSGNFDVAAATDTLTISAPISGAFNLTKTGSGVLNLSGANTFSGTFAASSGTTNLGANGALGSVTAVTVAAGATLELSTTVLNAGTVSLTSPINAAAAVTVNATANSPGVLNLAGGAVTLSSIAASSAKVSLIIGDYINPTTSATTAGGLTVGDSTSTTFAGVISGTHTGTGAALTKQGSGTLTLTAANTFTGGVALNAGALIVNGTETAGTSGPLGASGTISFNGGTLQYLSTTNTADYSARFSTAANQAYSINTGGQTVVFGSALTSSGGTFTKLGAGSLTLSGLNTFTGGVTLNGGVLGLGSVETAGVSGPLGVGGTISLVSGTLQFSATNTFDYSSRFSTAANQIYAIGTAGQNVTFASALVSSGGSLNKQGLGTLTLTGANTFTGNVTLSNGTLNAGSTENAGVSGPLGVGGTINFAGGTLQYSSKNTFDYSSRFNTTGASQAYNIDTNGQNVAFASALTSSGGTLTKLGSGMLTLTGTSTYAGGTTVSAGTLQVSNAAATSATGSGAVTVGSAGALQGSGYVNAGSNVITINGTLSPGAGANAPGTITLQSTAATGALTLSSTSVLSFDINSTGKDLVALGGSTLALNGGTLALNLPDTSSTGITYGATYALFTGVSGLTGPGFATVSGYDSTDYAPVFTLNGTEYDLTFTAVPEPSTEITGVLLVALVGWSQRRRVRT